MAVQVVQLAEPRDRPRRGADETLVSAVLLGSPPFAGHQHGQDRRSVIGHLGGVREHRTTSVLGRGRTLVAGPQATVVLHNRRGRSTVRRVAGQGSASPWVARPDRKATTTTVPPHHRPAPGRPGGPARLRVAGGLSGRPCAHQGVAEQPGPLTRILAAQRNTAEVSNPTGLQHVDRPSEPCPTYYNPCIIHSRAIR